MVFNRYGENPLNLNISPICIKNNLPEILPKIHWDIIPKDIKDYENNGYIELYNETEILFWCKPFDLDNDLNVLSVVLYDNGNPRSNGTGNFSSNFTIDSPGLHYYKLEISDEQDEPNVTEEYPDIFKVDKYNKYINGHIAHTLDVIIFALSLGFVFVLPRAYCTQKLFEQLTQPALDLELIEVLERKTTKTNNILNLLSIIIILIIAIWFIDRGTEKILFQDIYKYEILVFTIGFIMIVSYIGRMTKTINTYADTNILKFGAKNWMAVVSFSIFFIVFFHRELPAVLNEGLLIENRGSMIWLLIIGVIPHTISILMSRLIKEKIYWVRCCIIYFIFMLTFLIPDLINRKYDVIGLSLEYEPMDLTPIFVFELLLLTILLCNSTKSVTEILQKWNKYIK